MLKGAQLDGMESAWKKEVAKLELEVEDKQATYERDLGEIQKKSEESLAQLKNFYELEKENLESRLREEREKSMARLAQYTEEYDIKMRTEVKDKDEEINML